MEVQQCTCVAVKCVLVIVSNGPYQVLDKSMDRLLLSIWYAACKQGLLPTILVSCIHAKHHQAIRAKYHV